MRRVPLKLAHSCDGQLAVLTDNPEEHVQRHSTKPGMIKTADAFQAWFEGHRARICQFLFRRHLMEGNFPQFSDRLHQPGSHFKGDRRQK